MCSLLLTKEGKKKSIVICLGIISMIVLLPFWNCVSSTYLEGGKQLGVKNTTNTKIVWEEMERLSEMDGYGSEDPAMAVDSLGNIHVVWVENIDYEIEILYRRLDVTTANWSAIQEISNRSANGYSMFPDIEIDETDGVHVIWREETTGYSLLYRNFIDSEWSEIQNIVDLNISSSSHDLTILESNKAFIVWADEQTETRELFYKYQTNGFNEWSNNSLIETNYTRPYYPALASNYQNGIHLAWVGLNATTKISDIFYQHFNGSCWNTENQLIISIIDSYHANKPDIIIDSNNIVYFVWENNFDLLYRKIQFRSLINDTLGEIVELSESGASLDPKICFYGNNIQVIWNQNLGIYLKTLIDKTTWTDATKVFSQESILYDPLIGCDNNNNVHIVWNDYSLDKSWAIYYRKGTVTEKKTALKVIVIVVPSVIILTSLLVFFTEKKKKTARE